MFLDFSNSKISGSKRIFFRVKAPTNSSNFKTCFRSLNPPAKNLQKNLEKKGRDGQNFINTSENHRLERG